MGAKGTGAAPRGAKAEGRPAAEKRTTRAGGPGRAAGGGTDRAKATPSPAAARSPRPEGAGSKRARAEAPPRRARDATPARRTRDSGTRGAAPVSRAPARRAGDETPRPASRTAAPSQQRLSARAGAPTPAKAAANTKAASAAGPKRARARKPAAPPPERLEVLVAAAVRSLEDDKAENVVVLDVATRSAFADRMIVATGLAERQIEAMARHVEEALETHGIRRVRRESSPDWVLMDAGDIVIHLFRPEKREEVRLERMWGPDSPPPDSAGADGDLRPDAALGGDNGDAAMSDDPSPERRAPLGGALHPGQHDLNADARRPGTADGRPADADDGAANEDAGVDERPGSGRGGGPALPVGELLDGPSGTAFEVSGEDMVPTYADEAADEEERATGTTLPTGHDPGQPGRR